MTGEVLKVMLVDDEPSTLALLRLCIDWNCLGFQIVAEAENGQSALDILSVTSVDIVITDIKMDPIDGLALSSQIRKKYPQILILILTAFDKFSYAQSAIKIGVCDFILKPINRQELTDTLLQVKSKLESDHLCELTTDCRELLPAGLQNDSLEILLDTRRYEQADEIIQSHLDQWMCDHETLDIMSLCKGLIQKVDFYLSRRNAGINVPLADIKAFGCKSNILMVETARVALRSTFTLLQIRNYEASNKVLFDVLEYINQNAFEEHLSLQHLAAHFYLNPSYLSRIFSNNVSISFVNYICFLRMEQAKRLLWRSDIKAYSVSEAVGISDSSYFCRCFKRHTGFSVSEYRKKTCSFAREEPLF